jgi:hypothetical protein
MSPTWLDAGAAGRSTGRADRPTPARGELVLENHHGQSGRSVEAAKGLYEVVSLPASPLQGRSLARGIQVVSPQKTRVVLLTRER